MATGRIGDYARGHAAFGEPSAPARWSQHALVDLTKGGATLPMRGGSSGMLVPQAVDGQLHYDLPPVPAELAMPDPRAYGAVAAQAAALDPSLQPAFLRRAAQPARAKPRDADAVPRREARSSGLAAAPPPAARGAAPGTVSSAATQIEHSQPQQGMHEMMETQLCSQFERDGHCNGLDFGVGDLSQPLFDGASGTAGELVGHATPSSQPKDHIEENMDPPPGWATGAWRESSRRSWPGTWST